MKRKLVCRVYRCTEPPHLGGLCKVHSDEAIEKKRREDAALEALHRGVIDGSRPTNSTLREELDRLSVWWRAACNSINHSLPHALLKDETKYAIDWCIALAQELVDAERASRTSAPFDPTKLEYTRQWVWERFGNLERGLMSNGVKREK